MAGSGKNTNDPSQWIPRVESLYQGHRDDVSNNNAHLHITKDRKH